MTVKVLILEDNPVARSFLCRVVRESFSDANHITEAGDLMTARRHIALTGGAQGLHGADPFKLLLVDLELPDGNGMELLAELGAYPATKIVTTLYSDDEHLFPALQCGADGYLLKEDRFEVLVEELQKIVRGQPPLSPAIARRLLTHFRHGAGGGGMGGDSHAPDSGFVTTSGFSIGTGLLVLKAGGAKPEFGASPWPPGRKWVNRRRAIAGDNGGWPRTIFCNSSTRTSNRSSFKR